MAATPRPNAKEKGDQVCSPATREQLLIAAGELMIERGSADISLSEIADKSGLNSALVKYYFCNKAGLMMALLRKALTTSIEQLERLAASNMSPQEKLRAHIDTLVDSYFNYPYANRLMHQLMADDHAEFGPLIATEFGRPVGIAEAHAR